MLTQADHVRQFHQQSIGRGGSAEPNIADDSGSVDVDPALSGIGVLANIDHRLSVPPGVQESVFQAEHQPVRFHRMPEGEPTVGTLNLCTIADSGTTGFGH
jgi:hypothetical protein